MDMDHGLRRDLKNGDCMLKLSRVGSREWEFVYPKIYGQLMEEFNKGCECFEEGNLLAAERVFKSVLAQMPDHLDAIHHLAMVRSQQDLVGQAQRPLGTICPYRSQGVSPRIQARARSP